MSSGPSLHQRSEMLARLISRVRARVFPRGDSLHSLRQGVSSLSRQQQLNVPTIRLISACELGRKETISLYFRRNWINHASLTTAGLPAACAPSSRADDHNPTLFNEQF